MKKIYLTGIAGLCSLLAIAQSPRGYNDPIVENLRKITDTITLQQQIDSLLTIQDERNYISVVQFYYGQKGGIGATKGAEVSAAAKKKWPKGMLVAQEKAAEMMQEKDPVKKEAMYQKAVAEFGTGGFGFIAQDLAVNAAVNGDKAKMLLYVNNTGAGGSWAMQGFLANQLSVKDPAGALPLLKTAVDSSLANLEEQINIAKATGSANEKVRLERAYGNYYSYAGGYTRALITAGKPEEAWQFIAPIYQSAEKKNQLSVPYSDAAIATKKLAIAFPLMEQQIIDGTPSGLTKSHFKDAYIAIKGSATGFDEYKAALDHRKAENLQKEILAQAINTPAKSFELKDVTGKSVSLSDLKGKVVVLDFWATWCGPCKASFPIMQQAVNKYKNDPDVQFLFVHTMDKGDDNATASAAKYITDNKYNFRVLMDLRNKQTGQSAVSAAYGINAIPTKVVIDAKGNIRFQVTGFKSLDDRAVTELSAMIEFARKSI